jgi:hypothetical protein
MADAAELPALKQAMADAHPDKGSTSAAFIKSRRPYVAARATANSRGTPRTLYAQILGEIPPSFTAFGYV